eukprot:CAMPEP_0115303988 /NCGR_PEP_ID=MMETSP0270-20121206/71215_1 /TAXON_ID=71861 /ORGANISM="Scrippsiella trochoidea, Strain CCMP3099" /LENGTH=115 /DNA_ID=CAMNT_0002722029 /DNA_START=48 /DNA_END=392 /DNA_ORIENTATION=+
MVPVEARQRAEALAGGEGLHADRALRQGVGAVEGRRLEGRQHRVVVELREGEPGAGRGGLCRRRAGRGASAAGRRPRRGGVIVVGAAAHPAADPPVPVRPRRRRRRLVAAAAAAA